MSFSPPGFEPQTSGSLARKSSITTRPPSHPSLTFHFLKSSWRSLLLEARFFSLKFTKYRLAAGLCPDPLGELKRSPKPPSRNKGAYF